MNFLWWARAFRGYTVIEVLLVLAISGVVFVAGVAMFRGQGNATAFEQSMQDINSEIATRIRGVGSSQFFNSEGYTCTVSGSPAHAILTPGGGSSSNQECIVVGTAVEAPTGAGYLYFYEVLGNRLTYGAGNAPGTPATTLAEANPTPAVADDADLTFTYKLAGDLTVVSSSVELSDGSTTGNNLNGFYIDFSGEVPSGANGSQNIVAKAYNYQSVNHDKNAVKNCIEGTGCLVPNDAKAWHICFANAAGDRRAQVDITRQATGVTTELKFLNCT